MKLLAAGVLAAIAAASFYFFVDRRPADVYAMPVGEAYNRLNQADLMQDGKSFIGTMQFNATGNGRDSVSWNGTTSHANRTCKIGLAPWAEDAGQTKVTVNCSGGAVSDGAAAGMAHKFFRFAVIEKVDSTLVGRPYDEARSHGSTAAGWPGDGVDGSLATAQSNAIGMMQDAAKAQRQVEQEESTRKEQAKWDEFYDADPIDYEDQL